MVLPWMYVRAMLALISLFSLCTFGWGTYWQIAGQAETNQEMKQVARHIKEASALTAVTIDRMKPLQETAAMLGTMNGGLTATAQLLTEMNRGLASVTNSERLIVTNLTALNGSIASTGDALQQVSGINLQLAASTGSLRSQVESEHRLMARMNSLSDTSVAEMRNLNRKIAVLRALP
ncbi:hypothetical protein G3578_03750 [Brevibacillus sp. SYP-B805]|uniref:hypothetical protein n=1 Tax=Brevibacillus sp. SYP-B805 TaxID=1578199 RepID=UPI0013ED7E39|nr:hypothetical protein [Brevibacillus sp. SYP-B805]NGQ94288.1 hypothetical protein [Brevibacillus sp. SYP-B805]